MSPYVRAPDNGIGLPANSQRLIYLYRLRGRTLSARLLLLPTAAELTRYCGFDDRIQTLFSHFAVAHIQARAGIGRRLLGEMRLTRQMSDLYSVARLVFNLCDFCERNGHGSQRACSELAGHLGASMREDLVRWGARVLPDRRPFHLVQRAEEGGRAVFTFELAGERCAVRLRWDDDADEVFPLYHQSQFPFVPAVEEPVRVAPLVHTAHPRVPGDVMLSRSGVGFDAILKSVYPLISQLRRSIRLALSDGACLCGELVASLIVELEHLGVPVLPHVEPPAIARVCDRWKLLPG
jgi:hypothetical protein